jgi:diguanylate cyclase (GGDEF)-like protein
MGQRMIVETEQQKWRFVAAVTGASVVASVAVTAVVAPLGLTTVALIPSIVAPLIVAPVASHWAAHLLLRIHRLNTHLAHLMRHDQMTGLLNRGAFFEYFEEQDQPVAGAVLMADIDEFKRINDTYGHAVGDRVICTVAETMRSEVEAHGILARYGGEEFVAFLPQLSLTQAQQLAEQIRVAVEDHIFLHDGKNLRFTLSIGVEQLDRAGTLDEILICADRALYEAKRSGRNCVVRYSA